MDIVPLAGMLLTLLMLLIIAGSVLMFPLMRRLGRLMELRIEERRNGVVPGEELASLKETVQGLQDEVARLADRQAFTERLLEAGRPERGPGAGEPGAGEPGGGGP